MVKTRNCRKMSKKCPKMAFGASWQPPRKMSKKCLESVLVLGLALEKCPENVKKVSPRHFPDTFPVLARPDGKDRWPMEYYKVMAGFDRFRPVLLAFSGHFSSASPITRTLSRHFLDIFLGGCQEAPKGILGHFLDILRQFLVLTPFTS